MTAALVVGLIVLVGMLGLRLLVEMDRHAETRLHAEQVERDFRYLSEKVGTALAKVWHHVTPASPDEGAAVSVLRNAFPELPVPGRSRAALAPRPDVYCLNDDAADRAVLDDMPPEHAPKPGHEDCPDNPCPGHHPYCEGVGRDEPPPGWAESPLAGRVCTVDDLLPKGCQHEDIRPIPGNEDWGRCEGCREDDFPLTERAAYGDVKCRSCHDTGLVPVEMGGALADGPCPDCREGKHSGDSRSGPEGPP